MAGNQEGLVVVEESTLNEPEAEDQSDDFYWWLRNKDKLREEWGMSKEEFYRYTGPDVWECVTDYVRRTAAPSPVVEPYLMYLTLDELYDLPEVREFLLPAKLLEEMRGSSAS
jgi:hypothetical protein